MRIRCILNYLKELENGVGKMEASQRNLLPSDVADDGVGLNYMSRKVRRWGAMWLDYEVLQDYRQGKHPKFMSIINDEQVVYRVRTALFKIPKQQRYCANVFATINRAASECMGCEVNMSKTARVNCPR